MDAYKIDNPGNRAIDDPILTGEMQDRYCVKCRQFFVNRESGFVFCLVEAPDQKTCRQFHRATLGRGHFTLTEVEPATEFLKDTVQYVENAVPLIPGEYLPDLDFSTILFTQVMEGNPGEKVAETGMPGWSKEFVRSCGGQYKGCELIIDDDDTAIIIAFEKAVPGVKCAEKIQHYVEEHNVNNQQVCYKMALGATKNQKNKAAFFSSVIDLVKQWKLIAQTNQLLLTEAIGKFISSNELASFSSRKILSFPDEKFVNKLLLAAEPMLVEKRFNINKLCHEICISRSQLYRKITSICDRSPNKLFSDMRLQNALKLLKQHRLSIAQVAFQTGFCSPAYFTKCFSEKYHRLPSMC